MALKDLKVTIPTRRLSPDIVDFLNEADARIHDYIADRHVRISGFVPSDFVEVYRTLDAVAQKGLAPGDLFCEWGSGFGVVAMLAALLDFQAYGIEIEASLVDGARGLADDFAIPVEFVQGSFVPDGAEPKLAEIYESDVTWLRCDVEEAYPELGLNIHDFDVVYAFPWPGEEDVVAEIFDCFSSAGSLLLTYTQLDGVRIRRKVVNA